MADYQSSGSRPQRCFGRIFRRRVAPLPGRLAFGRRIGRFVVHQVRSRRQFRRLDRVGRVRQIGIGSRPIGQVGQFFVRNRFARVERHRFAPFRRRNLRNRKAVFRNLEFVDVQRRRFLAEQIARCRYPVAQRNAPHFERPVFQQQRVLRRPYFVPLRFVGQVAVEIAQVGGQYFAQRRRGINRQRRAAAVEAQRREQREQPVHMVAVQVRYEYGPQFQRVDARPRHLLLGPFARIDQVVLFVYVHHLRRRVARGGRFGRRRPQYGDCEAHPVVFISAGTVRSPAPPRSPSPPP